MQELCHTDNKAGHHTPQRSTTQTTAAWAHLHSLKLPEQPPLPGRVAAEHPRHVGQRAARQARQHKRPAHQHQALAQGRRPQGQGPQGGVQQRHAKGHHARHAQLHTAGVKGGNLRWVLCMLRMHTWRAQAPAMAPTKWQLRL